MNRIGSARLRVTELHQRALRPVAAVERELLAKRVEPFGGEALQGVRPRRAPERDGRTVEVPAVVNVVVGRRDRRQTVVRVVVEGNEVPAGTLSSCPGSGFVVR